MVMLRICQPNGRSSLSMPEEGIYDDHGHLFHHAIAQSLLPVHYERLAAHGIPKEKKKFTKEEDDIISANWDKYRKEHDLEEMEILNLSSFGKDNLGSNAGRNEFRRRTHMWPQICAGLPHRSADTVRHRIPYIYDRFKDAYANREFTEYDDLHLLHLRKLYTEKVICELTVRSFAKVHGRLSKLNMALHFSHSERRKLWNIVAECHPEFMGEWKIPTVEGIDWHMVTAALPRSKETLRNEWQQVTEELNELKEEGDFSFEEALDKVAPKCPRISAADFSEYLLILLFANPSLGNLCMNKIQDENLGKQMKKHGITGFLSGRYSEAHYCRLLLGRILRALRRRLLRPCSLRLSLSTQIRLLSHSFRCLPQATQSNGPLRLDRNLVIRQIENLMTTEDTTWKMSRKMKKYIEGEIK